MLCSSSAVQAARGCPGVLPREFIRQFPHLGTHDALDDHQQENRPCQPAGIGRASALSERNAPGLVRAPPRGEDQHALQQNRQRHVQGDDARLQSAEHHARTEPGVEQHQEQRGERRQRSRRAVPARICPNEAMHKTSTLMPDGQAGEAVDVFHPGRNRIELRAQRLAR